MTPIALVGGWTIAGSVLGSLLSVASSYSVTADFPGGNIEVMAQNEHEFVLAPDLRDTSPGRWWFYWNFDLRGPSGGIATIIFPGRDPIGVHGPALSEDGGATWNWMGAGIVRDVIHAGGPARAFNVTLPNHGEVGAKVRLAFGVPYVEQDLERFLQERRDATILQEEVLARSPQGLEVPLLRLGNLHRPERVVLLAARHHSCEAMASFVLEGFMAEVLREAGSEVDGPWRRWQLIVLPFMDRDGVEEGDQGKARDPHDHNQDYSSSPLYVEIAALREAARDFPAPVFVALDLHCPWIRGGMHERIHLIGSPDPAMERAQIALLEELASREEGLPVSRDDLYRFGLGWNTKEKAPSFARWAADVFPEAWLVSTLEFPYASVSGRPVTPIDAREFGRDLARALNLLSQKVSFPSVPAL